MKKRIICTVLIFVLFFSAMVFTGMKLKAQDTPVVYVDPPTSQVAVNEVFSVNVSVAYVTDLQFVGFKLGFNTTLLNATACYKVTNPPGTIWGPVDPVTLEWVPLRNASDGFVWVYCMYELVHAQNGDITVVTFNFIALATGGSTLHLYDTELVDPSAELIAHTTQDGIVTVVFAPTVPVGGISLPVSKLELLAPYIGLTILLAAAVVIVVYVKKRKRNTETNS